MPQIVYKETQLRMADHTNLTYFEKEAYSVIYNSYSFGVMFSRSSLYLLRIPQVTSITITQACNMVMWLMFALYMPLHNIGWLVCLMIFVGLLGGASYANIFDIVLKSDKLQLKEKELASTICIIMYDIGMLFAGIVGYVLDAYVLK
jgi:battenin